MSGFGLPGRLVIMSEANDVMGKETGKESKGKEREEQERGKRKEERIGKRRGRRDDMTA